MRDIVVTRRSRLTSAGHLLLLLAAASVAVATSATSDWQPIELVLLLLVLAIGSDVLTIGVPRDPSLGLVLGNRAGDGPAGPGASGGHRRVRHGRRRRAHAASMTTNAVELRCGRRSPSSARCSSTSGSPIRRPARRTRSLSPCSCSSRSWSRTSSTSSSWLDRSRPPESRLARRGVSDRST